MRHIGNTRITQSTEVDCIEVVPQTLKGAIWKSDTCFQVGVGTVIEPLALDIDSKSGRSDLRDVHRGFCDLIANSVSWDHRNACQPPPPILQYSSAI